MALTLLSWRFPALHKDEEDSPALEAMLSALPPKNANLGRFTNFVNLLDMCGVSVWSGLLRLGEELLLKGRMGVV